MIIFSNDEKLSLEMYLSIRLRPDCLSVLEYMIYLNSVLGSGTAYEEHKFLKPNHKTFRHYF